MKPTLEGFVSKFGGNVQLNTQFIVEKAERYYLLNPRIKKQLRGNFYYAGLYLGKIKNGKFFPSFNLLDVLVDVVANKVVLDRKAAWLFICGRDVFGQGVVKVMGSKRKGNFCLVLNEFGECLGFGMIAAELGELATDKVAIKNVLDVGDFLRRERRIKG